MNRDLSLPSAGIEGADHWVLILCHTSKVDIGFPLLWKSSIVCTMAVFAQLCKVGLALAKPWSHDTYQISFWSFLVLFDKLKVPGNSVGKVYLGINCYFRAPVWEMLFCDICFWP